MDSFKKICDIERIIKSSDRICSLEYKFQACLQLVLKTFEEMSRNWNEGIRRSAASWVARGYAENLSHLVFTGREHDPRHLGRIAFNQGILVYVRTAEGSKEPLGREFANAVKIGHDKAMDDWNKIKNDEDVLSKIKEKFNTRSNFYAFLRRKILQTLIQ